MLMRFKADRTPHRLLLSLWGAIDPKRCKFDVASANMLVAIYKAEPCIWDRLESPDGPKPNAAAEAVQSASQVEKAGDSIPAVGSKGERAEVAAPRFFNRVMYELD
jgi:hypothetical protein